MLYREIIAVCSQIHTQHIDPAVWAERGIFKMKLCGSRCNHRLEKFIKRNSLHSDVYIMEQRNITPLNALEISYKRLLPGRCQTMGTELNVWHTISSAWNIWTDRLRDPPSCLISFINVTGLGLLHKAVGVLQHTELEERTSHSLKYGASVGKSNSDTCLTPTQHKSQSSPLPVQQQGS